MPSGSSLDATLTATFGAVGFSRSKRSDWNKKFRRIWNSAMSSSEFEEALEPLISSSKRKANVVRCHKSHAQKASWSRPTAVRSVAYHSLSHPLPYGPLLTLLPESRYHLDKVSFPRVKGTRLSTVSNPIRPKLSVSSTTLYVFVQLFRHTFPYPQVPYQALMTAPIPLFASHIEIHALL